MSSPPSNLALFKHPFVSKLQERFLIMSEESESEQNIINILNSSKKLDHEAFHFYEYFLKLSILSYSFPGCVLSGIIDMEVWNDK